MPKATLTARVAKLEETIAKLLEARPHQPGRDDWMSVVGMFEGDETMKRIDEHGAAIRRAERRKARRA